MTLTRLKKVIGDLFVRWGRTLLTLAGLALGLYGIGSVLVAFTILSNDLQENFSRTNPPNVTIMAGDVPASMIARIAALPGVNQVENRPFTTARVEVGPDYWMSMTLYAVQDFRKMRVAKVFRQEGDWPPADGSLLVERDGGFWVRSLKGENIRVRVGNAPPVEARFAGYAYDPGQAPSRMERALYGYVTPATFDSWSNRRAGSRLLITVDTSRVKARTVAAAAQRLLESNGIAVQRLESTEELEHPHQFQFNSIIAMLAALAVFSLVTCAVLIVNLIDAVMTKEQRSIGMMRAIGGTSYQIAADYLLGMALLGLVASLVSLPLALETGRDIATFVATAVNFDLLSRSGPSWLPAFVILVGVAVPVLVAAYRVIRATRIPVREALSRVEPGQSSAPLDAISWVLRPFPLLQRMAVRTLVRKPRRVILTAAVLALGVAFFMMSMNVRTSMLTTVESVKRTKLFDLAVTFPKAYPNSEISDWLADFPMIRTWETWGVIEGSLLQANEPVSKPLPIFGVPAGSTAMRPDVIRGTWVRQGNKSGIVVTQKALEEDSDLRIGGTYLLRSGSRAVPVEIVGVIKEFGSGRAYAPLALLSDFGSSTDKSNHVLITLDDHSSIAQDGATAELERSIVASDWQIAGVLGTRNWERIILNHLKDIGSLLAIIAAMALFIGAMGIASSISVGVVERYREIGVLKAIGASSRSIVILFASEAVLVAFLGWLFATALSPWLSRTVADRFGSLLIEYPFDYRAADNVTLIAWAVATLIALTACILPIRAALQMPPAKALRSE